MTARFSRAELVAFHGDVVDDLVDDRIRLLFVGINPGLWTAAVNAHFARRGNRFWPALHAAGITPRPLDLRDGMSDGDRELVLGLGVGITNIVPAASARAEELSLEDNTVNRTRDSRSSSVPGSRTCAPPAKSPSRCCAMAPASARPCS